MRCDYHCEFELLLCECDYFIEETRVGWYGAAAHFHVACDDADKVEDDVEVEVGLEEFETVEVEGRCHAFADERCSRCLVGDWSS